MCLYCHRLTDHRAVAACFFRAALLAHSPLLGSVPSRWRPNPLQPFESFQLRDRALHSTPHLSGTEDQFGKRSLGGCGCLLARTAETNQTDPLTHYLDCLPT